MSIKSMFRSLAKDNAFTLHMISGYHRCRAVWLSRMSDERFAHRMYYKKNGQVLNLTHPRTFDEKQWWLKLHYRNPLMVTCTDKVKVREYVKSTGFEHILNEVYGVYSMPRDITWESLPKEFYLKTNNSSATNICCLDKEKLNVRQTEKKLALYLHKNHYALSREWNYQEIEPRIIVEKMLRNSDGKPLVDYRFICSGGKCKGVFVDIDTADAMGNHRQDAKRNVYDADFRMLNVTVSRPRFDPKLIARPNNFEQMRECAEALSAPFPFCRVDLYNIDETIIFGEITFFHAGGCNRITPEEWNVKLGRWIDLSGLAPASKEDMITA